MSRVAREVFAGFLLASGCGSAAPLTHAAPVARAEAREVQPAESTSFASLERSADPIRSQVRSRAMTAVTGCYELMLAGPARRRQGRSNRRAPEGRLVARFDIAGSGEVLSCAVEGDAAFTDDASMPSCVCNVLRSLQFEAVASRRPTSVNFPFRFHADR